jgi:hypothetical protein
MIFLNTKTIRSTFRTFLDFLLLYLRLKTARKTAVKTILFCKTAEAAGCIFPQKASARAKYRPNTPRNTSIQLKLEFSWMFNEKKCVYSNFYLVFLVKFDKIWKKFTKKRAHNQWEYTWQRALLVVTLSNFVYSNYVILTIGLNTFCATQLIIVK